MEHLRHQSKPSEATSVERVPINKELWSEKSRSGVEYVIAAEYYEDRPFICRACGDRGVFTAEQQKYTYEVKKAYVWEQHVLCSPCFRLRNELQAEASAFLAAWLEDRAALATNAPKLNRWREVLEQFSRFGMREDTARIRMLAKLLGNAA